MKTLRFLPKEVVEIQAKLTAQPFEGDLAPRLTKSWLTGDKGTDVKVGIARIYPSTSSKNEYCATIRKDDEEGWRGMCSCPGWAQCKRAVGAARPCVHILDSLMRDPTFYLPTVMGRAAAKEVEELTELAEKRAKAKAALAASAPPAVSTTTAVAMKEPIPEDAMKLWSSRFPLLEACPASNVRPGECLVIREDNQAAALGTVVHAHGLEQQYAQIVIYDNNDKVVVPGDITATDANTSTIDLTAFHPITGTWRSVARR